MGVRLRPFCSLRANTQVKNKNARLRPGHMQLSTGIIVDACWRPKAAESIRAGLITLLDSVAGGASSMRLKRVDEVCT